MEQKFAPEKISSLSLPKSAKVDKDQNNDSSSDDSLVPSLSHLKSARDIQCQVDIHLRELEVCDFSPKGKTQKVKSKRGGNVEVIVRSPGVNG